MPTNAIEKWTLMTSEASDVDIEMRAGVDTVGRLTNATTGNLIQDEIGTGIDEDTHQIEAQEVEMTTLETMADIRGTLKADRATLGDLRQRTTGGRSMTGVE